MSATVLSPLEPRHSGEFQLALAALRNVGLRHFAVALAVAAVFIALQLPMRVEMFGKHGFHAGTLFALLSIPVLVSMAFMLGWVVADANPLQSSRTARIATVLIVTSTVMSGLALLIFAASGGFEYEAKIAAARGKPPMPVGLLFAADWISTTTIGALGYAVLELLHRRRETQQAFREIVVHQTSIAQQVLEARLNVMQAQVEPRFLFDTLVDIETLYARDAASAADLLDRLIAYLRAALPKLREQGSTIGAEMELVRAYIGVANALHGGRPELAITMADGCAETRFYPMLLIPLVQRTVRDPSGRVPQSIRIDIHRVAHDVVLVLRLQSARGCAEDPELLRVRERLNGLFGQRARLECVELADETIELTMHIPAADNARRSA